ncbi:MAG: filamentous hemagglutinin N-terminal domain-containing protein, partial [Cyanobium sp.]
MAGLQQVKSGGSALGLAVTVALGFGAGQPPEAAAEVRAAADGLGTRVVVNGNEFTISDGKLSGANQFHSFDRFDLNSSQSARFQTPGQVKNILGRVVSSSPSMIDGLIRVSGANANLYIINPTGISFGPNARLDVPGSFHASTAQAIRLGDGWFRASGDNNTDALSGAPNGFAFLHNQPGTIINAGQLQVPAGETITLMGGTVINTGTLTAQGGTVNVVAVNGAKLVEVGTSQQLLSLALPAADQQTIADGLQPLTPASLPALLTGGSISHASTIELASDGTVRLRASGAVVPGGPGVVMASGSLDASGKGTNQAVGGRVAVLADVVSLSDATVDVSGTRGGGTALIGGDLKGLGPLPTAQRTTVDGGSSIHADAIEAGDGGKVVIWGDGPTLFQGQVTARGGQTSGDGGFVEISGKANLRYDGNVNTTAQKGATGTLLLDPRTIRIVAGSGGTNDDALNEKKQILAADQPDADMVISESKIETESINNDLAFEASMGISMLK